MCWDASNPGSSRRQRSTRSSAARVSGSPPDNSVVHPDCARRTAPDHDKSSRSTACSSRVRTSASLMPPFHADWQTNKEVDVRRSGAGPRERPDVETSRRTRRMITAATLTLVVGCAVGAADVTRESLARLALLLLGGRLAIVAIFTIVVVLPNPEGDGWGGRADLWSLGAAWQANLEGWSVLVWLAAVWHLAPYALLITGRPSGASLNAGAGDRASPGLRLFRDDRDLDVHASDEVGTHGRSHRLLAGKCFAYSSLSAA